MSEWRRGTVCSAACSEEEGASETGALEASRLPVCSLGSASGLHLSASLLPDTPGSAGRLVMRPDAYPDVDWASHPELDLGGTPWLRGPADNRHHAQAPTGLCLGKPVPPGCLCVVGLVGGWPELNGLLLKSLTSENDQKSLQHCEYP